eukprot:TRINITY_DN1682_c0_g1_i2.p1 TRINITY_DN1682_c0_g1~~TRINITY_DN1682_c0_g1_i2.p1  ORF type:complete len:1127 (-),score=367.62 TRINITY_DN1682_c0_g1_i2:58-3438(-)
MKALKKYGKKKAVPSLDMTKAKLAAVPMSSGGIVSKPADWERKGLETSRWPPGLRTMLNNLNGCLEAMGQEGCTKEEVSFMLADVTDMFTSSMSSVGQRTAVSKEEKKLPTLNKRKRKQLVALKKQRPKPTLFDAVSSGNDQLLELILHIPETVVNQRNTDGVSALHKATESGNTAVVNMLLLGGADVDARDLQGFTSLHLAALSGNMPMCNTLLDGGADAKAKTSQESTVMHYLVRHDLDEPLKRLMHRLVTRHRVDCDAANSFGESPVITASMRGNLPCVIFLFAYGADCSAFNMGADMDATQAYETMTSVDGLSMAPTVADDLSDFDDDEDDDDEEEGDTKSDDESGSSLHSGSESESTDGRSSEDDEYDESDHEQELEVEREVEVEREAAVIDEVEDILMESTVKMEVEEEEDEEPPVETKKTQDHAEEKKDADEKKDEQMADEKEEEQTVDEKKEEHALEKKEVAIFPAERRVRSASAATKLSSEGDDSRVLHEVERREISTGGSNPQMRRVRRAKSMSRMKFASTGCNTSSSRIKTPVKKVKKEDTANTSVGFAETPAAEVKEQKKDAAAKEPTEAEETKEEPSTQDKVEGEEQGKPSAASVEEEEKEKMEATDMAEEKATPVKKSGLGSEKYKARKSKTRRGSAITAAASEAGAADEKQRAIELETAQRALAALRDEVSTRQSLEDEVEQLTKNLTITKSQLRENKKKVRILATAEKRRAKTIAERDERLKELEDLASKNELEADTMKAEKSALEMKVAQMKMQLSGKRTPLHLKLAAQQYEDGKAVAAKQECDENNVEEDVATKATETDNEEERKDGDSTKEDAGEKAAEEEGKEAIAEGDDEVVATEDKTEAVDGVSPPETPALDSARNAITAQFADLQSSLSAEQERRRALEEENRELKRLLATAEEKAQKRLQERDIAKAQRDTLGAEAKALKYEAESLRVRVVDLSTEARSAAAAPPPPPPPPPVVVQADEETPSATENRGEADSEEAANGGKQAKVVVKKAPKKETPEGPKLAGSIADNIKAHTRENLRHVKPEETAKDYSNYGGGILALMAQALVKRRQYIDTARGSNSARGTGPQLSSRKPVPAVLRHVQEGRSEERRVGKECRSRWSPYH